MRSQTCLTRRDASHRAAPLQRRPARHVIAGAALIFASSCGLAQAADALTEAQLDQVVAGHQTSISAASASALFGFSTTSSSTYASSLGPIRSTSSTSIGLAAGIGVDVTASAATWYR